MRSMKKFGTAVAAASMLMALVGVGSASAANWDPANTTLTAHGTLVLHAASGLSVTCTYHSGVRSAGGADAFTTATGGTTPAPPTFSGCTSSLGTPTVTADQPWTVTATSTTAVDVTGNATITVHIPPFPDCKITATDVSLASTWSNATSTVTPGTGSFPISEVGALCPGDTSATMTGSVVVTGASIT
jgi:hypothetical protein